MTLIPELKDFEPGVPVTPEVFACHPDSAYWIGKVAVNGVVTMPEYYDALTKFRAKVYVDEMKFLTRDHIDTFGREYDVDDERSVNFAVVQNIQPEATGTHARIVGSGRVIHKREDDEALPIEHYFPEIFADNPLEEGSVEVSRFIARHEDRATQHTIALALIRAMTHYSVKSKVKADYCIIEAPLLNLLTSIGIPVESLGPPKAIDEYGGTLHPVKINPYEILNSLKRDITGKIALKRFFKEEIPNLGEGYYPSTLVGGYDKNH